jgi:hypothetical protein
MKRCGWRSRRPAPAIRKRERPVERAVINLTVSGEIGVEVEPK